MRVSVSSPGALIRPQIIYIVIPKKIVVRVVLFALRPRLQLVGHPGCRTVPRFFLGILDRRHPIDLSAVATPVATPVIVLLLRFPSIHLCQNPTGQSATVLRRCRLCDRTLQFPKVPCNKNNKKKTSIHTLNFIKNHQRRTVRVRRKACPVLCKWPPNTEGILNFAGIPCGFVRTIATPSDKIPICEKKRSSVRYVGCRTKDRKHFHNANQQ